MPLRTPRRAHVRAAATIALAALIPTPLVAATIVVDGGTCSLENAIAAANTNAPVGGCSAGSGHDTLLVTHDLTLAGEAPPILGALDLVGAVFPAPTITGDGAHRLLFIGGDGARPLVAIENVELRLGVAHGGASTNGGGAGAGLGGAIFVYDGHLTLDTVTFSGNAAKGGNGSAFGGIGASGGGGMFGNGGGNAGSAASDGGSGGFGGGGGAGGSAGADGGAGGGGASGGSPGALGGSGPGLALFGGGGGGGAGSFNEPPPNAQDGTDGGFGGGGGAGGAAAAGGVPGNGGDGGWGGGGASASVGVGVFSTPGNGGFGGGGGATAVGTVNGGRSGYGGGRGNTVGSGGGGGMGGALFIRTGYASVRMTTFDSNAAQRGSSLGSTQALGKGGAIFALDTLTAAGGNAQGYPAALPIVVGCNNTFPLNSASDGIDLDSDNNSTFGVSWTVMVENVCPGVDAIFDEGFDR